MYKLVHSVFNWVFRLCVILPIGVMALIALYLVSPVIIALSLVYCDSAEEFCNEVRTTFVDLPLLFFKETVFDI